MPSALLTNEQVKDFIGSVEVSDSSLDLTISFCDAMIINRGGFHPGKLETEFALRQSALVKLVKLELNYSTMKTSGYAESQQAYRNYLTEQKQILATITASTAQIMRNAVFPAAPSLSGYTIVYPGNTEVVY